MPYRIIKVFITMAKEREHPPVDEQIEGLRMNLEGIGFSERDEIERIIDEIQRLEVDQTHEGRDPNDAPFRITRTEDGFEFETDEDVA